MALDATFRIVGPFGARSLPAADFFLWNESAKFGRRGSDSRREGRRNGVRVQQWQANQNVLSLVQIPVHPIPGRVNSSATGSRASR
jgi:hypothetical protein